MSSPDPQSESVRQHSRISRRTAIAGVGTAAAVAVTAHSAYAGRRVAGGSSMPATVRSAADWKPGLDCDFTRARSLDARVWKQGWFASSPTAVSGPVNQDETAAYSPDNLRFDGDGLHFELTDAPVGGRLHTGAGLNTHGLLSLRPGCWVEARLNLPGTRGHVDDWPGFWLNGYDQTRSWPQYGEIDIVEGLDGHPAWHYHWGALPGVDTARRGGRVPGDFTGWHTFAARWEAHRIDMYYDGRRVGSVTENVQSDPHYIVLGHSTSNPRHVGSQVVCSSVRTWTHT